MHRHRNSTRVNNKNQNTNHIDRTAISSNNNPDNGVFDKKRRDIITASSIRSSFGRRGYSIVTLPLLLVVCFLLCWTLYLARRKEGRQDDALLIEWSNPALAPRPQVAGPRLGGFDFRGASRTSLRGKDEDEGASRLKIAIVTNAVAYPYDEKSRALWSMFKEYFANKDCYARTHGYDLIVDSRYVDGI